MPRLRLPEGSYPRMPRRSGQRRRCTRGLCAGLSRLRILQRGGIPPDPLHPRGRAGAAIDGRPLQTASPDRSPASRPSLTRPGIHALPERAEPALLHPEKLAAPCLDIAAGHRAVQGAARRDEAGAGRLLRRFPLRFEIPHPGAASHGEGSDERVAGAHLVEPGPGGVREIRPHPRTTRCSRGARSAPRGPRCRGGRGGPSGLRSSAAARASLRSRPAAARRRPVPRRSPGGWNRASGRPGQRTYQRSGCGATMRTPSGAKWRSSAPASSAASSPERSRYDESKRRAASRSGRRWTGSARRERPAELRPHSVPPAGLDLDPAASPSHMRSAAGTSASPGG